MVIGRDVKINGDLKFDNLLRIDGFVQGQLLASSEVPLKSTQYVPMFIYSAIYACISSPIFPCSKLA